MSNEFFPSIGSVAQKTDDLPDDEPEQVKVDEQIADGEEDRPLQEVESLCMNCGEQVSNY
jgi:zinc finger protein